MSKLKLTGIQHGFPSKKGQVPVLADIQSACRTRGVRFHYWTFWQWEEYIIPYYRRTLQPTSGEVWLDGEQVTGKKGINFLHAAATGFVSLALH